MTEHYLADEQALDFDDFANQLLGEGAQQSPAYLHGGISGIYAGAGPVSAEDCLAAAGQALDLGLHGELAESSLRLADITRRAMQDEEFDFHLFLPDDDTEMSQRVHAMSEWCQGFLAGYALVVAEDRAGLGEETSEVLKDVAAIAHAGHDEDVEEEESEGDYFELTEYLRFASLNLFMNRLAELEDSEAAGETPA